MEDEKPDTRHLVLKPKEIELTEERSRPGDGTAISVQLIHRQNVLAEEKAARDRRRGRDLPRPPAVPSSYGWRRSALELAHDDVRRW